MAMCHKNSIATLPANTPQSKNVGHHMWGHRGPTRSNEHNVWPTASLKNPHVAKHSTIPSNSLTLHTFWIVVFCAAGHVQTKQSTFNTNTPT